MMKRMTFSLLSASAVMLAGSSALAQAVAPPPAGPANVQVQPAPGGANVKVDRGGPGASVNVAPGGDVNVKAPATGGTIVRDPAAVEQRIENRQQIREDRRELRDDRLNDGRPNNVRRDNLREDIRQERRDNRDLTRENIRSGAAATTNNSDQWRFKYHNNHWWYYTPQNSWVFWYDNNWQPYDATTYYNYYPRRGAAYSGRYSTGYRGVRRGAYVPNQATVNGANIGGAIGGARGANIGAAIGGAVDDMKAATTNPADAPVVTPNPNP